jgi:hypothetical protein
MTVKTRYFVVVSLLVLGVGLGTGLVAYYVGFPTSAFLATGGPEELRYLPSTSAVVAYADVREVMASELRQRFRESVAGDAQENGQHEFQQLTGINIETDIDRVVAGLDVGAGTTTNKLSTGVVLARGRFDEVRIEGLMREHGAHVDTYKGKRVITVDAKDQPAAPAAPADPDPAPAVPGVPPIPRIPSTPQSFSLTFIEPGLAALGTTALVQHVVDLHNGGGESARTNEGLMERVKALETSNVWAVGRFDVLRERARLPEAVADRLPPITWFAISGRINGGVEAQLSAEARDEASANNLRDVVRGFLALAKLQTSSKPEYQRFVDSLQLSGTGKTVALSVDVPAQLFDALHAAFPKPPAREGIK